MANSELNRTAALLEEILAEKDRDDEVQAAMDILRKPKHEEYSLGVTGLLDELLQKEHQRDMAATDELSGGKLQNVPDEAIFEPFQRTADLFGEIKTYLSTKGEIEGAHRWEALEHDLKADRGLTFLDTLGSTHGSLTMALQANDLRLARLRDEIEALKEDGVCGSLDDTLTNTITNLSDFNQTTESLPGLAGVLDLEKMLSECIAAAEETRQFQGLVGTPAGWRRLDRQGGA
jgi:hypothetical protein